MLGPQRNACIINLSVLNSIEEEKGENKVMLPLFHFSSALLSALRLAVLAALHFDELKQLARRIKLSSADAFKTVFELYSEYIVFPENFS